MLPTFGRGRKEEGRLPGGDDTGVFRKRIHKGEFEAEGRARANAQGTVRKHIPVQGILSLSI